MNVVKTEVIKSTWSNGKGVMTVFHFDKKRDGLRAVHVEFENGAVEIRLMQGDGRKLNCVIHLEVVIAA